MDPAFKARWMMNFGVAFSLLGFAGRFIIPPQRVAFDVCGVGVAVGIVLFIQGYKNMRAAVRADIQSEEEDAEPPKD